MGQEVNVKSNRGGGGGRRKVKEKERFIGIKERNAASSLTLSGRTAGKGEGVAPWNGASSVSHLVHFVSFISCLFFPFSFFPSVRLLWIFEML